MAIRCPTCWRPSRNGSSCTRTRSRSSTCGPKRRPRPLTPHPSPLRETVPVLLLVHPPDLEVRRVVGGRSQGRGGRCREVHGPDHVTDLVRLDELLDVLLPREHLERGLGLVHV